MPEEDITSVKDAVEIAKRELSKRVGIDAGHIEVICSEEATWPDTSLGMPEPGMVYAQMLVSGYRVLLSVHNKTYEFHFGNGMMKMR